MSSVLKEEEERQREEGHVKMEAEIEHMLSQVKKCLGLLKAGMTINTS